MQLQLVIIASLKFNAKRLYIPIGPSDLHANKIYHPSQISHHKVFTYIINIRKPSNSCNKIATLHVKRYGSFVYFIHTNPSVELSYFFWYNLGFMQAICQVQPCRSSCQVFLPVMSAKFTL